MRRRFASLTSRLVITAVVLVAMVSLLIGGATALAMRSYLSGQLDEKVTSSVMRAEGGPGGPPSDGDGDNVRHLDFGNQEPGTLVAVPANSFGLIVSDQRYQGTALTAAALDTLAAVPVDGQVHQVDVDGHGTYRVIAANGDRGVLVTGLATADLNNTVDSLLRLELLLTLLGVIAAGVVGRAVVRRQLRPLREVAETAHTVAGTPLDSGEIGITSRVPEHLTDDATEVGQMGAALNTLLEHVETSLDARHRSELRVRQFVADASHELRTPLTTIAGYTQLARRRPEDTEATATALAKVEEESARMTALVEDLLLLARLDSGRPLEKEPVDVTRMLLEAVSDARVVAPDHRWRLDLPDEAIEVTGDEQRLHQVVTNLLTNARKYTPAGTTVTLTAHPAGFRVHDDGPGFPPDLVDDEHRAFERFTRGDVARNRQGGVGLGLALVEAIVTAHDGKVSVHSAPGDTTIDVRLGVGAARPLVDQPT